MENYFSRLNQDNGQNCLGNQFFTHQKWLKLIKKLEKKTLIWIAFFKFTSPLSLSLLLSHPLCPFLSLFISIFLVFLPASFPSLIIFLHFSLTTFPSSFSFFLFLLCYLNQFFLYFSFDSFNIISIFFISFQFISLSSKQVFFLFP